MRWNRPIAPRAVAGLPEDTLVRAIGFEGNPILLLENGDLTQGAGAEHELRFQTAFSH